MPKYIECESFIKRAIARYHQQPSIGAPYGENWDYLKDILDAEPQADVSPVVRGEWKFDDFDGDGLDYQCSVCEQYSRNSHDFCPNCGAKMYGLEREALTNYDLLIRKPPEELADLIFFELAQFLDRDSLLSWLREDAKEKSDDKL